MRKVNIPSELAAQVFPTCVSRIRDVDLKARLESIQPDIIADEAEFRRLAQSSDLYKMGSKTDVRGIVTGNEMSTLYTQQMAAKKSHGRPIYDKLRSGPANGRCPLCGLRVVSTLDHYLPKAHFATLTVVPLNLVPACSDCNKRKSDALIGDRREQTLHPYFDDIEDDPWLGADIISGSPVSLRFVVLKPDNWDNLKLARVEYHFRKFDLNALYISHAADELAGIRHYLNRLFQSGGEDFVLDYLTDQAESRKRAQLNSWQSALYKALSESGDYCAGGFNLM